MTVMVAILCYSCAVEFHVPKVFDDNRRQDHGKFFCPNGHSQVYLGKTEVEKLREQLDQNTRTLERTKAMLSVACRERDRKEAQRRAEKAAKTVLRKKLHPEEFKKDDGVQA